MIEGKKTKTKTKEEDTIGLFGEQGPKSKNIIVVFDNFILIIR